MATYLLLNLIFIGGVLATLRILKATIWNRHIRVTTLLLLILTAVFDSLIISSGIVAYDPAKLLGIYIWLAPIEDFFYAVLAGLLIPSVWNYVNRKQQRETKN